MTRWFYSQQGQTHGPYTAEELKGRMKNRLLQEDNWLWPEGSERKDGAPAHAALDFSSLPKGKAALPDWLEDVAKQGATGPVPPAAPSHELPDWLEDLRLWWQTPIRTPLSTPPPGEQTSPVGPSTPSPTAPQQPAEAKPLPPVMPTAPASPSSPSSPASVQAAPVVNPTASATTDEQVEKAVRETGFDPRTGQVLDLALFEKWMQQRANTPSATGAPTNASLMEVFRKARIAVERWVDEDDHRPLILRGDLVEIRTMPALVGILQEYARYGPVMREKLLHHLAFLVENRRKLYLARPN